MSKNKRKAALCLALVFILMILLSSAVTAVEAGHDCAGADCPICNIVTAIHSLVRSAAAVCAVFAVLFVMLQSPVCASRITASFISDTPIAEKVKLLN